MIEEKDFNKLANEHSELTVANLSKLIKVRSFSSNEKNVAELIRSLMIDAGFDHVEIDGIGNVIGRIGKGPRLIAFDGHMDTVEAGNLDNWQFNPFSGEVSEGHVLGRGSVDQKGGIAAFITAGKIIKTLGAPADKSFIFTATVMEEDCDGLCWKYIIEESKILPECVVITEPTDMNIYRGQRGRMEIEIEFRGISSHGSAPERGENAVYSASDAVLGIERLNGSLHSDEFLGKGSVTVTEFVSRSPSLCAVPDYAKIHLDRRLTKGENRESAIAQLEGIADKNKTKIFTLNYSTEAYTGLKYGMEKYYPTWAVPEDQTHIAAAKKTYRDLFGAEPVVGKWTFSTNGVVINGIHNIPIIGFGPGNEELAHAPNEKVPVEHLVKASAFYASLAFNL